MDNFDSSYLNEVQRQAVSCINGTVLVLAGAGSGKTRVLTERIAYMVNNGVPAHTVLAITFTNKAANEMRERLNSVCPRAYAMTICTIHSFCARILRSEAYCLGYTQFFSIYDEDDSGSLIKRILNDARIEDDKKRKIITSMIRLGKTYNLTPDELYNACTDDAATIEKLYKKYDEQLKSSNAMDFDDLLNKTLFLFENFPQVLRKYQQIYQYISVDEFQDTNKVQYQIIKLLAGETKNLFVVGDDDQAIYSWRGAEVANILDFEKDFPDAKIFKLEENYRSTKKILQAANNIICKNTERHEKTLFTANDDGVKVERYTANDETQEAAYVVQQIMALARFRNCGYSDFAILMRVNSLSRVFEQECLKYNIPVRIYGGFRFFERKEVKDVLAYLRLICNCYDNEALLRIINVPRRSIGLTTTTKLVELSIANGVSIYNLLADSYNLSCFNAATRLKLQDFYKLIDDLIKAEKTEGLYDFVKLVVRNTKYKEMLTEKEDDYERALNIDELLVSVKQFEEENDSAVTLSDYLQSVSLSADREDNNEEDAVTLSTVHSAKGLEFNTVFVVGLDDGIFPISRAQISQKDMEEERRLMYVACTRAKKRLYVTRAISRFIYGARHYTAPSAYYAELAGEQPVKRIDAYDNYADDGYSSFSAPKTPINVNPPPKEVKDFSGFAKGDEVSHPTFGEGIITDIIDSNATVLFSKAGKKVLALKYAPLVKVKK